MREEVKVFFTALMFYTRIPCPSWIDHSPEYINKSVRYFPVIGWIVGGISAVAFLAGTYAANIFFGILLSMVASVLTTGAFHEDGFADVCDGFGGGWTKEKIFEIMKDSRIGAYGVVGLILLFGLKVSVIAAFNDVLIDPFQIAILFLCGHAVSRFIAATFIFTHNYVRDTDDSKAKPVAKQTNQINLLVSGIFGLLPLVIWVVWSHQFFLLLTLPAAFLAKLWLGNYFSKWIGGYTGDCLGATQQVVEVVFYLSALLVWKFI